MDSFLQSF